MRIVSFSVDPARDSPPVLNDFAHRFGGPTLALAFSDRSARNACITWPETYLWWATWWASWITAPNLWWSIREGSRLFNSTFDPEGIKPLCFTTSTRFAGAGRDFKD